MRIWSLHTDQGKKLSLITLLATPSQTASIFWLITALITLHGCQPIKRQMNQAKRPLIFKSPSIEWLHSYGTRQQIRTTIVYNFFDPIRTRNSMISPVWVTWKLVCATICKLHILTALIWGSDLQKKKDMGFRKKGHMMGHIYTCTHKFITVFALIWVPFHISFSIFPNKPRN
jgi:hypothetical protein